jgi:N-acetylmuramoyl-L-alanine amidase
MLRGDDVAALQRRLGALGFDAGRVDGIFGPLTQGALSDFQRNAGLTVDGVFGPESLRAVDRVSGRLDDDDDLVAGVKERERMRLAPRTLAERRLALGHFDDPHGLWGLAGATESTLRDTGAVVQVLGESDESAQAAAANDAGAEIYLGLRLEKLEPGCRTAYFRGHDGFCSDAGRRLATFVHAAVLRCTPGPDRRCVGMRVPILRETRMPAVLLELGPDEPSTEDASVLAVALRDAIAEWSLAPCDD